MNLREKWECVIDAWMPRVAVKQTIHEQQAKKTLQWHYWVGVPTVIVTAIVGASWFSDAARSSGGVTAALGIGGTLAAALTGIQTFFQFAGTAERNRLTAVRCSALLRDLELQRAYPPRKRDEAEARMRELHRNFSDMENGAPLVMACLIERPNSDTLRERLNAMATASTTVTNLGFKLWEYADAAPGCEEELEL
jgi:hypothetical protein